MGIALEKQNCEWTGCKRKGSYYIEYHMFGEVDGFFVCGFHFRTARAVKECLLKEDRGK